MFLISGGKSVRSPNVQRKRHLFDQREGLDELISFVRATALSWKQSRSTPALIQLRSTQLTPTKQIKLLLNFCGKNQSEKINQTFSQQL